MDATGSPLGATVLIVEDDADLAQLIQDVLETEGFHVLVATRGDAAIAVVEHVRPHVALVDKELPGTPGLDLVEYLSRRLPGLPIIFMTAFGGHLVERAAHDRGAAMYLDKPVRLDTLVATVGAAVTGVSARPAIRPADAGASPPPAPRAVASPWGVVLIRPQAARLEVLARRSTMGAATGTGGPPLLRGALARLRLVAPPERTLVVGGARAIREATEEISAAGVRHVLVEPADRGSAARTLYPVHWIARLDPEATVAVVPHDHIVGDARGLAVALDRAVAFVHQQPRWVVLLGSRTSEPDAESGWIIPGGPLGDQTCPVRAVERFVENPSEPEARALHGAGALWSTAVLVARADLLRDVASQLLSPLHHALARAVALDGSEVGHHALRRAYRLVPPASLSAAVLQDSAPVLGVLPVEGLDWGDWGTPRRAAAALRRLGMTGPAPGPRLACWRPASSHHGRAGRGR